jgi:hypothetical protein
MSPIATSVQFQPPAWFRDILYPSRPTTPTQGVTTGTTVPFVVAVGYDVGQIAGSTPQPLFRQANVSTGNNELSMGAFRGLWAVRVRSLDATGTARANLFRNTFYTPSVLSSSAAPATDPEPSRVSWLRVWLLTDATAPVALDVDRVGVTLRPDDGSMTASNFARTAGGVGVCQVQNTQDWRYVSYSPAGALLEAIALATGDGWHVADFIIRQGKRGDATTPWLTFRWDGTDVVTQRAFGDPLLSAPTAFAAAAMTWTLVIGGSVATAPWELAGHRFQWRHGPFHPDGYPVF